MTREGFTAHWPMSGTTYYGGVYQQTSRSMRLVGFRVDGGKTIPLAVAKRAAKAGVIEFVNMPLGDYIRLAPATHQPPKEDERP